jgi:hypothetical protein
MRNYIPAVLYSLKVHIDEVTLTCMTTIKATPLKRFPKGDAPVEPGQKGSKK